MAERTPVVETVRPAPGATPNPLPERNRRTALVLVIWIVALMLASALVAWFRN